MGEIRNKINERDRKNFHLDNILGTQEWTGLSEQNQEKLREGALDFSKFTDVKFDRLKIAGKYTL